MDALPRQPADGEPAVAEALDEVVALDDYLGGFAPFATVESRATGEPGRPDAVARLVDTILLLRQTAAADGVAPAAASSPAPRSIGRHTILRRAGQGGFATVWEGFDTWLRRPVAVKVRRDDLLLSDSARRRFVREAEIAARLVHPHIVTIFEVGDDHGREFIAAEFCSGGSLADWLERHPGPLPPGPAARIVRALAAAVSHAHEAGVIHRDIKPGNVLLVPAARGTEALLDETASAAGHQRGFTVKLGDFGLGKVQHDSDLVEPLTELTRSGTTIGTPAWMAPEQLDRSFGVIGPATDVHGLGLLLHRLLTGCSPRDGDTDAETYRQVLLEDPVPADRVVRGVPRDLAAVAARCLAKHSRDRYATADELAADLTRWLEGRPTLARPLSSVGRATRWLRRRPGVAWLGAAVVAASLVAAWTTLERARDGSRHADEIRRQKGGAELRRAFDTLRSGNVAGALAQLETVRAYDAALAASIAGRWLTRRTHGEEAILLQPAAAAPGSSRRQDLYAIALTADGTRAAVAGADGSVHLMRDLDGTTPTVQTVAAHDEVNAVAFSRDGTRLATAGQDGRLRWWHVSEAGLDPVGSVNPGGGPLYGLTFTPDGQSVVTGGEDRVVRRVPLDASLSPLDLFQFEAPPGKSPEVEAVVFVDEETIAAACGDLIVLLDAATGRLRRTCNLAFPDNRNAVLNSLTVSPDGRRLLAGGSDSQANVWDVATGVIVASLADHPAWVQGSAFSPDGTFLATACRDGSVRIFDAETGRLRNRLTGHVGRVWSVVFEPRGTLLTTGADGTVRRWNPQAEAAMAGLRTLPLPDGAIKRLWAAPPPGGARPQAGSTATHERRVIALNLDADTQLREVDIATGQHRLLAQTTLGWPADVDLDPSRRRLVVTADEAAPLKLISWAAAGGTATSLTLRTGADTALAKPCWLPDGGLTVYARDGTLSWHPPPVGNASGTVRPIGVLDGDIFGFVAAPVGPPRVVSVGSRTVIQALPSGASDAAFQPVPPLPLPVTGQTVAAAWSPDATLLAVGTRSGAVELFDTATGAARGSLVPHERRVEAIAFSPDGQIIVTADLESVRISDVASLITFDEVRPEMQVYALCLTPNGSAVVIGGQSLDAAGPHTARLVVMELTTP